MRVSVFKQTRDDWCGSYTLADYHNGIKNKMLVEVIFNGNITAYDPTLAPVWRTCVWGNDDCGMEFDCSNESEALNKFLQVVELEYVDMSFLAALGYVSS